MSSNLLGKGGYTLGLAVWVVVALFIGQALALLVITQFTKQDTAVTMTVLAALGYILGRMLALGVPVIIWKKRIAARALGVDRSVTWSDISLGILGFLPYILVSAAIVWLGTDVAKVIDPEVGQDIPFQNLSGQVEYFVAFFTLVIMAPLAEELLFRGYFLGRLSVRVNRWLAVFVTAFVFGLMHLLGGSDAGIVLQWGAAADTFAVGLVLGSLRIITGSIWAGVILHALKNGIAFYFLFIFPSSGM
jgi:membrane protease YdiL (CAAX protease family)